MGEEVVWNGDTLMGLASNYQAAIHCITTNIHIAKALANVQNVESFDEFSVTIVRLFAATGDIHGLMEVLIEEEFLTTKNEQTLLRGNNIVTKLQSAFVRLVGLDYLRTVLQDLVLQLLNSDDLTFEIDPVRLTTGWTAAHEDPVIEENAQMLRDTAQIFIDRVTDPASISLFPRELRAIAACIYNHAKEMFPGQAIPLVGSFAFLRVISPALVTPESFGVLPPDMSVPTLKSRRNLVLLAKVLQNCANGVLFGTKEDYMTCMNEFALQNNEKMTEFLEKLVMDEEGDGDSTWSEFRRKPATIAYSAGDFDLNDLMRLHCLMKNRETQFLEAVATLVGESKVKEEELVAVRRVMEQLGPAPFLSRLKGTSAMSAITESMDSPLVEDFSSDCAVELETEMLAKAGFFFVGPPTKSGDPVVWLVVSKFKFEYLDNMNTLISYVYKVMKSLADQPYNVIVDMTWARISNDAKKRIYAELHKLQSVFEHRVRKNLSRVYIVHPSAYSKAVILFMRSFTSGKLKRKIQEVYDWKDLTEILAIDDIMLPETSKDYVTTAYTVVKINAKGKRQKRLIKMTPTAILNIDPKNNRIQNEKKLGAIRELIACPSSLEIKLRFEGKDKTSTFKDHGRSEDSTFRRYICSCLVDRDNIIRDLFRSSILSSINPDACYEYHVVKVNNRGRRQDRIFVITCDSLLNLDKRIIKSEHSFAGIEDVVENPDEPGVLRIKFKMNTNERKIICNPVDAQNLIRVLREAMRRYGLEDEWATRDAMFSDHDKEDI